MHYTWDFSAIQEVQITIKKHGFKKTVEESESQISHFSLTIEIGQKQRIVWNVKNKWLIESMV
jgi:alpha-galactosidase/6-phospho-beta-glucosidase family protein